MRALDEAQFGGGVVTMTYRVWSDRFDGTDCCMLRDDSADLQIGVLPGFGANMISLKYRGVEVMRGPESLAQLASAPTRYGNPVMMPPNRIWNGTFEFEGRKYGFPLSDSTGKHHIHGLVKSAPWHIDRFGTDADGAHLTVSIASKTNEAIWNAMPIDFTLTLDFVLSDGVLHLTPKLKNSDSVNMPFGLGFHPYFLSPLAGSGDQSQCFIRCAAAKRWVLHENFPTGELLPADGKYDMSEWVCLEGLRLDDIFSDVPVVDGHRVVGFEDRGEGIGLEFVTGTEYPHWVVFTGPEGSQFVCLEPETMVTNAFNSELSPELTGMGVLAPGQTFEGPIVLRPYRV